MLAVYSCQFYLFCVCVQIFTLFTYLVHYSDLLSTIYLQNIEPEYDFIIVGAGTAGSLIAHRLAKETNYSFIVLEAGSRSHALLEAPVLGPFMHRSLFDWHFETVPQDNACLGMNNKQCRLAQGKIIGGSSKLNNMIHIRGNLTQYFNWFHGRHTEEYIRRQFEYIENNILYLDQIQYQSDLSDAVLAAAKELGYEKLAKTFKSGFMRNIVSQKNGKRWTTSDNLDISKHIISNTLVEKVLFNGNTAIGVSILLPNKRSQIYAKKGIILTAGAINTPKILQLSGIGPESLLKSLGIPFIKNLPVGNNLQDHVGTGLDFVLFNKSVSISPFQMINPAYVIQYLLQGRGPWTTPGCEVIGFLYSDKNQSEPDLQFMVLPVGLSTDRGSLLRNSANINNEIWNKYFSKMFDNYAATFLTVVSQPKSRGHVYINSTDPNIPPLINPRYLSHPQDRKTLINGLKLVMEFVKTNSIKNIGGFINPNHFPGCEKFEIYSDSYFDCYISHLTLTSYHPIGTCSMGLPDSKNTVVDRNFKVLGIERLYVADSSVLPTIPSANINAAVAMMASVFFDTNVAIKYNIRLCNKIDFVAEVLFSICINR